MSQTPVHSPDARSKAEERQPPIIATITSGGGNNGGGGGGGERSSRGSWSPRAAARIFKAALPQSRFALLLVVAALALGGFFRLYGLTWDQNAHYHPDERWITMVTSSMSWPAGGVDALLDPQRSTLNPYWEPGARRSRNFAYGTLPVYSTKIIAWFFSLINERWGDYDYLPIIGRALSGLLDTGAIFLVFLLGRRLWGEWAGGLAALFYALTVLSIQHSHFYTTDVTLNFFILLTILGATEIVRAGDDRSGFLTGAAAGLALASKFSAAPILAVIPVALALRWFRLGFRGDEIDRRRARPTPFELGRVLLAAGIGFLALNFLFQPYAYLDFRGLLASIAEQNRIIVTGEGDVPYTRQYIDTTPYLYFVNQIPRWATGWPLGLAGFAGWAWLIVAAVRRRSAGAILLLTWMIPYFLITGRFHAKFLRYALPLLPFLALAAAFLLSSLRERVKDAAPASLAARAPLALAALIAAGALFWSFSFFSIYTAPHSANQAAWWINGNVPAGSVLLKEHWEEGLANLRPVYNPPPELPELPMYEDDDARKLTELERLLVTGDYIVFYSNRLYGTVPRLTERYPMSRRYYELLFTGQLGYELVHFTAPDPHFMGVSFVEDTFSRPELPVPAPLAARRQSWLAINGGFADESFTAYDHPLVMVFKKTRPVSAQEIDVALRPFLPLNRR